MRQLTIFFALVFFAVGIAAAQTAASTSGLHELVAFKNAVLPPQMTACGDYFRMMPVKDGPGILFKYYLGPATVVMETRQKKTLKTLIEERDVPAIEFLDHYTPHVAVVVHLSKKEYDRATDCLPKPDAQ